MNSLHISRPRFVAQIAEVLRDVGEEKAAAFHYCCMGAAARGPEHCTCWEPIYDQQQKPPTGRFKPPCKKACHDCAYRAGSPERSGNDNYHHAAETPGGLPSLRHGAVFYCHQGLRRIVAIKHSGTGYRLDLSSNDYYEPVKTADGLLDADGDVAPICAGYWARVQSERNVQAVKSFTDALQKLSVTAQDAAESFLEFSNQLFSLPNPPRRRVHRSNRLPRGQRGYL